ncbi:tetratricopeptide repeat protein [Nodularia sp. LEGE 04288]|uniref:tetratricopeptide repeat protein n=1 Tax=Nodularia sp. LEGE 04288 TaxID=1828639 RepID=UPI001D111DD4|nr:tetratricopeptide repeat protein [Nodularia sp. LEGE 04288]MCC2692614.1 tetratricopeptide repeat protein [Nodularia sp. LEGE 04288]
MLTDDVKAENQRNYQKLIVSLEASQGILNLLIAVCDDSNLRAKLIQQYETELKQQDFLTYRVRVRRQDPSLRYALAHLVETEPDLQQSEAAVITVLGVDELLSVKLDSPKSEQDRFFGYLQWTREALREFTFPVVLWVTESVLIRLAERAPDFWSWRGGVFCFTRESVTVESRGISESNHIFQSAPEDIGGLPLEEILQLIAQIEAEGKEAPLLATLYESLAKAYEQRYENHQNRQLAIQAYQKAIALQTKLGLKADLADSLKNLGNLYFELKNEVKLAEDYYEQAQKIYRDIGDLLGEAYTLKAIGDVLQFLNRHSEALEKYEQALAFYRDVGDRLGEAYTLKAIGDVLQFLNRSSEALEKYEQALAFYRDVSDRLGEPNTLRAIGDVFQFLDRTSEALEKYEQALAFYRDIGDRLGEANTLQAIGDVFQFLKCSSEALEKYEQALAFYRDVGSRLGEANTLRAIGDVLQFLKRSSEALEKYEQALAFYRDIGDRLGEANTLQAIGDVLQFLNRSSEALEKYEQALAFYRNVGSRLGEANTLRAIGDVLQFLNRSSEALEKYEQALGFYRDVGDRLGEANTLQAIGDVLQFLKRNSEALEKYEQALTFYRDVGDRLGEANTLQAIGDVLQFLKRNSEALEKYEQALGFYRDIGSRLGEANVLQEFGKLQDNPAQALEYLQQAQSLYNPIGNIYSQSRNLLLIADMQFKMGQTEAAINSLTEAAELADAINYEPFQKYAQEILTQIKNNPKNL